MGPQRHGWFPAGLGAVGLAISQELRVTCHLAFFYDEVLATGAPCLPPRAEGCMTAHTKPPMVRWHPSGSTSALRCM